MYSLKSSDIILSPSVKDFLSKLERNLPFDFVVTSGTRTPEQQVSAMFYKVGQGEDLKTIYKDDVFAQKIMDVYPDRESAIQIVQEYAESGKGSSHLRGLGLDLRTRDKTIPQRNQMIAVAKELGGTDVIYEDTPPHIHITVPKKKLNLASLGILILLLKGVTWAMK